METMESIAYSINVLSFAFVRVGLLVLTFWLIVKMFRVAQERAARKDDE